MDNAVWYVDTSLDYERPDPQTFAEHGRRIAEAALERFRPDPGRHVALDLGTGLGRVADVLAPRFRHVVGADLSPEMLRRARSRVAAANCSFVVTDARDLACIRTASVDFVVSFAVLQHLPSVRQVLACVTQVARVLRPGGQAALQVNLTPGSFRWAIRRRGLAAARALWLTRNPRRTDDARFLGSRVPLARLRRHLGRAGLEELAVRNPDQLFGMVYVRRT